MLVGCIHRYQSFLKTFKRCWGEWGWREERNWISRGFSPLFFCLFCWEDGKEIYRRGDAVCICHRHTAINRQNSWFSFISRPSLSLSLPALSYIPLLFSILLQLYFFFPLFWFVVVIVQGERFYILNFCTLTHTKSLFIHVSRYDVYSLYVYMYTAFFFSFYSILFRWFLLLLFFIPFL